jgi:BlaI family penicillinase repressor
VSRDTRKRTHVYAAQLPEEKAQRNLLRKFVDTAFGGSASQLVLRALGEGDTSAEELAEIKRMIQSLENQQQDD